MTRPVVLSYGAGQQTTALLVLIAQGVLPRPDAIIFCETGTEQEATYRYLDTVVLPYVESHGLVITRLGSEYRTKSQPEPLDEYCFRHHMVPGGLARWCTGDYKIKPAKRFRKAQGWTNVETWLGISTDEPRRAKESKDPLEILRYPLIELGFSRTDCVRVIRAAGLPVPPKSGCWCCPFRPQRQWYRMRLKEPDLFARSLAMERNAKRSRKGRKVYLPMFGPLEIVASQQILPGFDEVIAAEASCVSGWCFV